MHVNRSLSTLEFRILNFRHNFFIVLCLTLSCLASAQCSDFDAKLEADKAAQDLMSGKTFKSALILKTHLPSKRKEVASYVYVKTDDLYYTVYSLVNSQCQAKIIKRTNGKH
jgi:hypothetical protein